MSAAAIEVAVALPVYQTYTYGVPEELIDQAAPGRRVLIPFGKRQVTGYVLGSEETLPDRALKPILDFPDEAPLFPSAMISFFRWIADYYIHPIGEVIKCALPGGLNIQDVATVEITASGGEILQRESMLSAGEKELLSRLKRRPLRLAELLKQPEGGTAAAVQALVRERLVRVKRRLKTGQVKPQTETFVAASGETTPLEGLSPQRKKILDYLRGSGETTLKELKRGVPTTSATVRALALSGHVTLTARPVYRDPFGDTVQADTVPRLTPGQKQVVDEVIPSLGNGFETFLLAGVTGSGKTEVYMHLADEVIRRGSAVLILTPEIALISQMERRFRARFGDRVALLHSGLSRGERFDQWMRVLRGEAQIAIGARSAIFAPFKHIGIIVVDEEHDPSYKQEGGLHYNARDLAVVRAQQGGAVALLGSATPSIQSYHNVTLGKFREISLKHRIEQRPLPEIRLVDLRKTRDLRGSARFISAELAQAMGETISRGEQTLLFLNRRGTANFPVCVDCGEPVRCRQCDISLTLHQDANAYKCHYCGYSRPVNVSCEKCASTRIRNLGLGTEKLAQSVQAMFPDARVARMDRDTTSRKGALLGILKDLRRRRIDILVGTQMVAKGHDFPYITLVGIICADLSMNFPDFRAGERTFQLLAQVAGRAGRGDAPGRVILQTYNPDHFSISAAQRQDFKAFFSQEIGFRRALNYPPFSRIIQIRISGRDSRKTRQLAADLGERCRRLLEREAGLRRGVDILGPIEAALTRIAGKYRWQILIKGRDVRGLQRLIRTLMRDHAALFSKPGTTVTVDVDPFFMM